MEASVSRMKSLSNLGYARTGAVVSFSFKRLFAVLCPGKRNILMCQLVQGGCNLGKVWDESAVERRESQKLPDLTDIPWSREFTHCGYQPAIGLHTFSCDSVPQVLQIRASKMTFCRLRLQTDVHQSHDHPL